MMVLFYSFIALFFVVCALLCISILIQESKSLGLGASFGGDASDSLFGTSTAAVLKKFTAVLCGVFIASCFILSLWTSSLAKTPVISTPVEIEEVQ